ncbi:spermidine resistance protein [Saitoella coloradoensis]
MTAPIAVPQTSISSSSPATSYTINHENTAGLPESAFEGPEKLLEVWFAPSPEDCPSGKGLKTVARKDWEGMLDLVNCKVLSVIENDEVDAYLLSESSMFVFPHKLILKTCGTTTLLIGLPRLLSLAASAGFTSAQTPWRVFYSRKSFMFPDRQLPPHKSWHDEVEYLDKHFEGGSAYHVGRMNGDHWFLYMTSPGTSAATGNMPTRTVGLKEGFEDETLEILMTDLCERRARQFYLPDGYSSTESESDGHALGTTCSSQTKIDHIYPTSEYPDARVDSYLFTPCGYSANGVVPTPSSTGYWTIHVTPEPHCSYASFETNVPTSPTSTSLATVEKVVDIFGPGKFTLTRFEARGVEAERKGSLGVDEVKGYKRRDRIVYEFEGYDLVFLTFEKEK